MWEGGNHKEPMWTHCSPAEDSVIYAGGRVWPDCLSHSAKCQVVGTEPKHKGMHMVKPHQCQFEKVRLVCPSVTWDFVVPSLLNHRQLYFTSSFYCLSFVLLPQSKLEVIVKDTGWGITQWDQEGERSTCFWNYLPGILCHGPQTRTHFCPVQGTFRYLNNEKAFLLWVKVEESIIINWTVPGKFAAFSLPCVKK